VFNRRATIAFLFFLILAPSVFALSPRVFVASSGSDVGTCPRSAPCRNFAYAITQVSPGGELVALDTAGYGPVAVTIPVSIYAAPGAVASITAVSGDDITINVGPQDVVTLRGLFLNSNGSTRGIGFDAGGILEIDDTVFTNFSTVFTGRDLDAQRSTATDSPQIYINNCRFLNSFYGIYAKSTASPMHIAVSNTRFENINPPGVMTASAIYLSDIVHAAITDSSVVGNFYGVYVVTTVGSGAISADANLERCTLMRNLLALNAFASGQDTALIRVAYCMIVDNNTGISGVVLSRTDGPSPTNTLEGNTGGNVFIGSYAAK
jgi:hypothetical protein